MLRTRFPTAHHFTVSLFGCQYHAPSPDVSKRALIQKFDKLVKDGALHVEKLEQNDLPSKVWTSHWKSPQHFKAWWERPEVAEFWAALPDDAGFWRETVSLPATRAMYESNGRDPHGSAHCGELIPLTEKMGCWGAYRSCMTQDTPDDKFSSPLPDLPEPKPLSDKIRPGRTRITNFPDNICFMVEGRDESAMPPRERAYWDDEFDDLAKQWITNVMTAGAAKGLVSGRACHAFADGKHLGASPFSDGKGVIECATATSTIPETASNGGILVDRIGPTIVPFLYVDSVGLLLALSVTSLRMKYWQPILIAQALLIVICVSLAFYSRMPRWWGKGTPVITNCQGKGASDDSGFTTTASSFASRSSSSSALFPGLDYPQQNLLLFWLDLSHIEHLARYDKVHVKLRHNFLAAYGPGGVMAGGDILLWVDMGILKGDEMDAEYVGCYEGSGFMAYDHDAAFESRRDTKSAGLPVFFDEPRESKPME
ncbi:hypothetical protein PG997_006460 [Apiospora hydei]|uniref:Uncharacterized protein n=1 Tax=Apiospora hydei TaxID=1337664 RepID=A0ABR1WRV3_9PEZI